MNEITVESTADEIINAHDETNYTTIRVIATAKAEKVVTRFKITKKKWKGNELIYTILLNYKNLKMDTYINEIFTK